MKNAIKLLSLMLVAGTMFVSCGGEVDPVDPITPTTYTVKVNANDATLGNVTISPMKDAYEKGETVTITATPNDNANFLNWNGTITENPYNYVVEGDMTFTANFEAKPVAGWSATFEGVALDVAGFGDAMTNGQIFLFQCAKNAEGNSLYLPIVVNYLAGSSTSDAQVANMELYKDNYYTYEGEQYGDWQFYAPNSINCTLFDLTTLTVSATMSCTMYDCGPLMQGTAATEDDCPHGTLALTLNNVVYEMVSKGSFHKMNVK